MSDTTPFPPIDQADVQLTTDVDEQEDSFRVVIASEEQYLIERVTDALGQMATVAALDPQLSLIDDLIDKLDADLLILDLDTRPADGESLLDIVRIMKQRRPALPVIVSGDAMSSHLVLAAMRAGAVDFVDRDITVEEVKMQIAAHLHRHHDRTSAKAQAVLHIFCSAREDHDTSIAAVSLGCALSKKGNRTLLLDLSSQGDEAALVLGMEPTYSIEDALLDLPRLDETLLLSALSKHKPTGLFVLPMQLVNSNSITGKEYLEPAKLNAMLTLIRPYFDDVVLNVSGAWLTIGLAPLLSISAVGTAYDYLTVQPNLISISGASRLLRQVFGQADAEDFARSGLQLLVVNEEPNQVLEGKEIAETLGLPYAGGLPAAPAHHPDAINEGVPLILTHSGHPYSQRVRQLLIGETIKAGGGKGDLVNRLRTMIGRG